MKTTLSISIGQSSSKGRKPLNQDFHGVSIPAEPHLSTKGIAVALADGISSSNVSQVASETAVKGFLQDYYCTSDAWAVKTSAQVVLKAMNSWLYSQTQSSPHRYNKDKGYICTFSGIIFKSNTAHIFHSGDSRIYRVGDDHLEQLTKDHRHTVSANQSYLTRALGFHDNLEIDYAALTIREGDLFLLATDGIYEFLTPQEIIECANRSETDLQSATDELLQKALEKGSDDNLTLQLVKIESLPSHQIDEVHQQVVNLPPPEQLRPRMDFDGFHIIRALHIGPRSHVFLAEDVESKQKVVIKSPSMEMRDQHKYLESMMMEEWIAKRLNNPHILKCIHINRARNYLYTVSEFIEGQTLDSWMLDNPSPPVQKVRDIVAQIATGLQALHRQEMVHQDLRPKNILIDKTGTVKIIDFGATKVSGVSEFTPTNEGIVGTALYSAPEYFLGEHGTSKSDIFSLGVITYQMLSGQFPYGNDVSKTHSIATQRRLRYAPLLSEKTAIPGWVDYAISQALHVDPFKRYTEVAEFIYDLRNPNPKYISKNKQPLIERNPVQFWQGVSLLLLVALAWSLAK